MIGRAQRRRKDETDYELRTELDTTILAEASGQVAQYRAEQEEEDQFGGRFCEKSSMKSGGKASRSRVGSWVESKAPDGPTVGPESLDRSKLRLYRRSIVRPNTKPSNLFRPVQ